MKEVMQFQTGIHAWKIYIQEENLVMRKKHEQNGEEFWETELTVEITEGNTHKLYSYLSEYIDHEDHCLNRAKDIWKVAKVKAGK